MAFIIQNVSLSLGGGTLDLNVVNDDVAASTLGAETSYGISLEQLKTGLEENPNAANVPELLRKILVKIRDLWE